MLNYNHLLHIDSTFNCLIQLLLSAKLDTSGIFNEAYKLKPKAFLDLKKAKRRASLFPGAGLYYVGEKRRAVSSALMCFAFLGYAAYSIYTKYYFTAALTGGGEFMRFYKGGKRASIKIGNRKNRIKYLEYVILIDEYISKKVQMLKKFN